MTAPCLRTTARRWEVECLAQLGQEPDRRKPRLGLPDVRSLAHHRFT